MSQKHKASYQCCVSNTTIPMLVIGEQWYHGLIRVDIINVIYIHVRVLTTITSW